MEVTLKAYEEAERRLAQVEGRRGFMIHLCITVAVWAVLVPVNIFLAPAFPWSAFVVAGMTIGLIVHYVFGVRLVQETTVDHQRRVEQQATIAAA
jgi:low affinity Fe/Cu permease